MRVCSGAIPTSKPITPTLTPIKHLVPHTLMLVIVLKLVVIGKPK